MDYGNFPRPHYSHLVMTLKAVDSNILRTDIAVDELFCIPNQARTSLRRLMQLERLINPVCTDIRGDRKVKK